MKKTLYHIFYKQFLLVMLLPTTILTISILFFSGYIFINSMKSEANNIVSTLEQEITYYTKQLNGCANTLTDESLVFTDLQTMDSYSKFQLIRTFNGYKNILGYCTNIGIIDSKNHKVISSDGEASLSSFFDATNLDFMLDVWNSMDSSSLLYPYETKTSFKFLYITGTPQFSNTFLFFTFDSYRLYNTIANSLKDNNGSVLLNNIFSNELFSMGSGDHSTQKQYAFDHPFPSTYSISKSTLVSYFNFPEYNLSFYVFLPFSSMTHMLLIIFFIAIGVLLSSFFMGLLLVRYMAKVNYTPIKTIKCLIPQEHISNTENELTLINHAIIHMNEKIGELNTKLNTNRENIKKSILIKLLYRQYSSEQDFLADAYIINIQKLYPYFTLYVLHYEHRKNAPTLYAHLCQKECPDYQCFILNSLENKQLILIYNFPQNTGLGTILAKELYQDIFQTLNLNITIGISEEYQPFSQIPQLYEEAVQAVNYSFFTGKEPITFSVEAPSTISDTINPLPEIDYVCLERYILDCNDEQLIQFFYNIFEKIQTSNHTLNNIKIYLFDMFSRIRKMLFHLNISDYQIIENELSSIFMNAETLEELFNLLYAILLEIGKNLHTVSDEEKIQMIQQYIYDHLCDIDFNVNSISDYFHISMPTLSRFYKQKTGQNISVFISELKIDKAKEMLLKTDHSIDYIVENLAYSNTSSFIRKFKSIVGMTPGQYRNTADLHKDETI